MTADENPNTPPPPRRPPAAKRPRKQRSLEERAADLQARANRARAKALADRKRRSIAMRLMIADAVLARVKTGNLHVGEVYYLGFLEWLVESEVSLEERAMIRDWWREQGWMVE